MAFSFRNLFKKDEENSGEPGEAQQAQPRDTFYRPTAGQQDQPSDLGSPFSASKNAEPSVAPLPINVPAAQIIPHIPLELCNPNGLAPSAIVRLPAADSSGGLKLTEVYQACPALFSYAPDVRDSREIFVGLHTSSTMAAQASPFMAHGQNHPDHPQHQIGSLAGEAHSEPPSSSPFTPAASGEETAGAQTPARQSASPFETSSFDRQKPQPSGFEAGSHPPAQSPAFETGFLTQSQTPGFETGSLPPQQPQPSEGGERHEPEAQQGFFNPPTRNDDAQPPPQRTVAQELDASALPFAPAPRVESPEEAGEIKLSLLNLLRGVPQEDLGFDPEEVPADVRVELPLSLIRPQLASGNVVVPLTEIIAGCEERYHPAFVNSREGAQVPLPLQEIFHNLPGQGPEAPSTAEFVARQQAEGAPIFDPTAPQAEPEQQAPKYPTEPVSEQPPQPPIPEAYAGPVTPPPMSVNEPQPEVEPSAESAPQAAPDSSTLFPPQGLSSQDLLGSPFRVREPAPVSPAPFPHFQESASAEPATLQPEAVADQPTPEPVAPVQQQAPEHHAAGDDFANFDSQTELDQLALRAIFQVDHRLTARGVLDLCCGLTGVGACVALHPGGAISADANSGAGFGEDAAGMFQNVAGLARGLGIGEADTFTIRTRKGTFSFFSQGELCLGVLHDPSHPAFGPGTREKLFLVARELGSMISD